MAKQIQKTGQQVCHIRIAEVAKAAAGELYESMMGNNQAFELWKKQNPGATAKQLERRFIQKNWPRCIDFARTTLTLLLTKDDVAETVKEEIMDVLEKDQILRNKAVGPRLH